MHLQLSQLAQASKCWSPHAREEGVARQHGRVQRLAQLRGQLGGQLLAHELEVLRRAERLHAEGVLEVVLDLGLQRHGHPVQHHEALDGPQALLHLPLLSCVVFHHRHHVGEDHGADKEADDAHQDVEEPLCPVAGEDVSTGARDQARHGAQRLQVLRGQGIVLRAVAPSPGRAFDAGLARTPWLAVLQGAGRGRRVLGAAEVAPEAGGPVADEGEDHAYLPKLEAEESQVRRDKLIHPAGESSHLHDAKEPESPHEVLEPHDPQRAVHLEDQVPRERRQEVQGEPRGEVVPYDQLLLHDQRPVVEVARDEVRGHVHREDDGGHGEGEQQ
mmetsp:Transcript_44354/g.128338  ORF Transcript_44354/g.128338 Transcript_44354/m.128338 type:complete len:330 (+) Transcript_44354:529-1518(+)